MPTPKINIDNARKVAAALSAAGLSGNTLVMALAQVAHETAGFKDSKIVTHNNASGITFANNPKKQLNATKGNPLPESPQYNYAKFGTLNDWAKDYLRIVGSSLKKSTDSAQYALRLANQKYYEVSTRYPKAVENYTKGLNYWSDLITKSNLKPATKILPIILVIGALFLLLR